jgi:hypothetical protein
MLANKVMVLGWPDRTVVPPKLWRFAFPVVSTAQELRAAARDLTKKDNPYRPAFDSETEEREWDAALNKFLRQLQSKDDGVIQGWLPKEGASSFDPALYAEMADSHAEFRLALAWAYSKTGRDEDVPKAHNLAMTFFLRSRLAAEEGGEDYWRANAILLDLYLDTAERWSKDSTTSADAAALLDRAAELVQRLYAYYPRFGEETIAGNGNAWRKRVEHLNKLRGDARMSRVLLTPTTVRGPGAANDSSSGR